jgi:hypothetical protein
MLVRVIAGAKVTPGAVATLLPSIKGRKNYAVADAYAMMAKSLNDDKQVLPLLCPWQVTAHALLDSSFLFQRQVLCFSTGL